MNDMLEKTRVAQILSEKLNILEQKKREAKVEGPIIPGRKYYIYKVDLPPSMRDSVKSDTELLPVMVVWKDLDSDKILVRYKDKEFYLTVNDLVSTVNKSYDRKIIRRKGAHFPEKDGSRFKGCVEYFLKHPPKGGWKGKGSPREQAEKLCAYIKRKKYGIREAKLLLEGMNLREELM